MTTFDERERGFEAAFAHDQEMMFRLVARRDKLLGQWAAGLMGLTGEEADVYARAVVEADFEEAGDEDVVRKLHADLAAARVDMDQAAIRTQIAAATVEARRQLLDPA